MNYEFPSAFVQSLNWLGADEQSALLQALAQSPVVSLRANGLKPWRPADLAPVPWEPLGFYPPQDFRPGADPVHFGGGYYMQDAGAMMPARVLAAQPGERVLDLCAAPGGKSGQIAADLQGKGLLFANEYDPARARILARNLERLGVDQVVVLNESPQRLACRFPEYFDAILVDAPCSGEGMFRKDPAAAVQWEKTSIDGCARRQAAILDCAAQMLAPGGRIVYATCTFNRRENEETVAACLARHPNLRPGAYSLPGLGASRDGCLRVWPHRARGEGQFAALLVDTGRPSPHPPAPSILGKSQDLTALSEVLQCDLSRRFPGRTCLREGDALALLPLGLPDLRGLRTLRSALPLARIRGRALVPEHALAMALGKPDMPWETLSPTQARRFLAGETLPSQARGWRLMTFDALPLGFAKAVDGLYKNHVPRGLRIPIRTYEEEIL